MMDFLRTVGKDFLSVVRDVLPVLAVILVFQLAVLRRRLPNPRMITIGFIAMVVGLYLFLVGLDMAIFPVGEEMAVRLSDDGGLLWTMVFAICMGYATTVAEPALLAVAMKAEDITAGSIRSFALRNVVAGGVALGLALGVWRIFTGHPLWLYILAGYVVVLVLTWFAPREIVPLAYDSGGVTTSTITVPLVTALGLGLARNLPGRNPLTDGFGLIAFASVFPMIAVLGYSIVVKVYTNRTRTGR